MQMVMVVYNEALDDEVMEALGACGLKNYTKIPGVFGAGASSGTHLGNDIWPGSNNILYVACAEAKAKSLLSAISDLKQQFPAEGIKAFDLPLGDTL